MTHEDHDLTRAQFLRRGVAATGALALPALLAACGAGQRPGAGGSASETRATTAARIPRVRWGINNAIGNLDLRREFITPVAAVLVQDGLLATDAHGRLQRALAVKREQVDDVTYRFHLRPGVTFSDGSPLTAADVVASLHADAEPGSQLADFFGMYDKITARGRDQVEISLKRVDERFQYPLITGQCTIMPRRLVSRKDVGSAKQPIVGTGPYRVTSFTPGTKATFAVNQRYWGPAPAVQQVLLTMIEDDSTRLLAMQSGDLDGSFNVPAEQLSRWQGLAGVSVDRVSNLETAALVFNTTMKPFDDVHARRALAYCWDRKGLVDAVLRGNGQVAAALPMPEQYRSVLTDAEVQRIYDAIPQYDLDLGKARSELAASSSKGGFAVEIQYPSGYQQLGLALQSLAEQANKIGIRLTVKEVPPQRWQTDIIGHTRPLQVIPTTAGTSDPMEKVAPYYDSRAAHPGQFNFANYRNAAVDRLLAQARRELDPAKRGRLLGRLLAIAGRDVPYAPLWWPDAGLAHRSDLVLPGASAFAPLTPWAASLRQAA